MSTNLDMHSRARQLTIEQQSKHIRLERAGVRPIEQLSFLRQAYPDFCSVITDIYNNKHKGCRDNLNGRMPIQALFDELLAKRYCYDLSLDSKDQICDLMFAKPQSIALPAKFCDVIVLDCT